MTNQPKPKVLAIVGPTASGKTHLARFLAEELGGELVSADSRQVYKRLDIGTGKEKGYPQHLIDIIEPMQPYSVADYQRDAYAVIKDVLSRGKLPILVGGTGLYVSSVLDGYDFTQRPQRNPQNPRHAAGSYRKSPPAWDVLMIGIELSREELYKRIDQRVDERIKQGMIDEAKQLIMSGVSTDWLRSIGLEYRYLVDLIEEKLTEDEFKTQLKPAIHRYARRQLAWWRHHGSIQWIKTNQQAIAICTRPIQ